MSDELREFKLSGGALQGTRKRQTVSRKNRQGGGDNSGALMQLANQAAPAFTQDLDAQKLASEFQGQVGSILGSKLGPNSIQQFGGKKSQKGGSSTGAIVNLSSTRSTPVAPGAPGPVPAVSGISPSQPAPVGGARLVLKEPKRKTRINLKARKHGGSDSGKSNVPPGPVLGGGQTRKARKIHLRVKGVTARLAKAKKAKRTAMTAPIADVKARLEAAGVVKKGSKAPESMMRTMYADLLITKKGL
jgi:hypothetical protein